MFAARNSSPVNHGFNTEEVAAYQVGGDTVTLLMSVTIKVFLVYAMSKESFVWSWRDCLTWEERNKYSLYGKWIK